MSTRRHPLARALAGLTVVVLAGAGLVACGDDGDDGASEGTTTTTEAEATEVAVSDAWARPVQDLAATDATAIYLVIKGGSEDDALVKAAVPADVAGTVELHETVAEGDSSSTTAMGGDDMGGGMMSMQPVESIPVPAGETVELKPGGFHIMVTDVKKVLSPGDTIEVTLTFETAGEVSTTAEVREP